MITRARQHDRDNQIEPKRGRQYAGVIDLFSGVGGFSLGAARAGFELLAAVDNDQRAAEIYKLNFPEGMLLQEDIACIGGGRLLDLADIGERTVHGIIGGPPCQGFSWIGRRNPDDERNDLFGHFFRLVAEIRPWFYAAENVVGILDRRFKALRTRALSRLHGYRCLEPQKVKSSDYGAATKRERVLFIGYRPECIDHLDADDFKPPQGVESTTVEMALRGLPRKIDPSWQTEEQGWRHLTMRGKGKFWDKVLGDVPPQGIGDPEALYRLDELNLVSACLGTRHTRTVEERFRALEEGAVDGPSRAVRLDRKGFCPTIRAGTGPDRGSYQALRPIHPTEARVITPREAARLQGFPDWFQFDATKWHSFRLIGNSVSPFLAEGIMMAIFARVCKEGSGNDS